MDTSPTAFFQLLLDSRRRAEELIDAFHSEEAPWVTPTKLRTLLTPLSPGPTFIEALAKLRDAITSFLDDVDRTALSVITENHRIKEPGKNLIVLSQEPSGPLVSNILRDDERQPLGRLQNSFRQMIATGLPADRYRPPVFVPLVAGEDFYVGGLILLRELHASPISPATLQLVEILRPIFEQIILHLSMRGALEHQRRLVLLDAFWVIFKEHRLTPLECRVLLLLLYGISYSEIAEDLGVTINTVRKHVKSIHAKTGTSSTVEIYARFIAQRITA